MSFTAQRLPGSIEGEITIGHLMVRPAVPATTAFGMLVLSTRHSWLDQGAQYADAHAHFWKEILQNSVLQERIVTAVLRINDGWKRVAGDGNCCFRSILCSCGANVDNEAVLKLRAAYAQYFGNHQKRFKNAVTSQNIIRGSQHVQSGQFFQLSTESHTFMPLSTSTQRRGTQDFTDCRTGWGSDQFFEPLLDGWELFSDVLGSQKRRVLIYSKHYNTAKRKPWSWDTQVICFYSFPGTDGKVIEVSLSLGILMG